MTEIEIKDFLKLKSDLIQIIDIREQYEHEEGHISELNIPMDQVLDSIEKIEKEKTVIVYCNSGKRGAAVVHILRKKYLMKNVYNLSGGYQAYIEITH